MNNIKSLLYKSKKNRIGTLMIKLILTIIWKNWLGLNLFEDVPAEKKAGRITSIKNRKGNIRLIWFVILTLKEYAPTATGFKNITIIKLSKLALSSPDPASLKL